MLLLRIQVLLLLLPMALSILLEFYAAAAVASSTFSCNSVSATKETEKQLTIRRYSRFTLGLAVPCDKSVNCNQNLLPPCDAWLNSLH